MFSFAFYEVLVELQGHLKVVWAFRESSQALVEGSVAWEKKVPMSLALAGNEKGCLFPTRDKI